MSSTIEKFKDLCRKLGGELIAEKVLDETVYRCRIGSAEAKLYPSRDVVEIKSPEGTVRLEYLNLGVEGERALDEIRSRVGAESIDLATHWEVPLHLVMEFRTSEMGKAFTILKKMVDKDMYPVVTNLRGEIRFVARGESRFVDEVDEWINELLD